MNRRRFLRVGAAAAAAALACGGLGYVGTQTPEPADVDTSIGGAGAVKKVLVTYSTRAGSTAEVAEAIAKTLSAAGATVDVRPIKKVADLKGYDAVVIGSAIRMGAWLPEAVEFVKKNAATLSAAPTAYFLVSGYLRNDTPEMRQTVQAYLDPVRKILEPRTFALFAGKMDYSKISFLDRTLAQAMKEPEGDWRNWEAIRAWAESLQHVLGLAS